MVETCIPDTAQRPVDWRQLPVFTPGDSLWSRIEAAQYARVRARRWQVSRVAAAAAVLVAVVAATLSRQLPPRATQIAAGQRESQALEREWQQLAQRASPATATTLPLRVIDVALQSAYDRGAGADELASLWQQRNRALRGLIARVHDTPAHDARALTRI